MPSSKFSIQHALELEVRAVDARRRLAEFEKRGESFNFEQVVEQIRLRDETEFHREHSPLVQCDEAVVLDTSAFDFEASCVALQKLIEARKAELSLV